MPSRGPDTAALPVAHQARRLPYFSIIIPSVLGLIAAIVYIKQDPANAVAVLPRCPSWCAHHVRADDDRLQGGAEGAAANGARSGTPGGAGRARSRWCGGLRGRRTRRGGGEGAGGRWRGARPAGRGLSVSVCPAPPPPGGGGARGGVRRDGGGGGGGGGPPSRADGGALSAGGAGGPPPPPPFPARRSRAAAGHDRREAAGGARRRRRDRHRPVHVHGLPGAVRRQADPAALLPGGRARRGGAPRLPLPDRDRHGDGAAPGLRIRELGDRLRRLQDDPGHVDAAARPVAREDRDGDLRRRRRAHRRAGRGRAADDPEAPGRARQGGRLRVQDGLGARVLPVQGVLRRGGRRSATRTSSRARRTSWTTTCSRPPRTSG